jgi:hypothetical protein
MAETSNNEWESNLKARRTQMSKTRSDLEDKLRELRSRFTITSSERKTTMATKARKKSSSTAKKPVKKAAARIKKKANKVMEKSKEVLGEVLAGAAKGAIKGAAEAVETETKRAKRISKAQ